MDQDYVKTLQAEIERQKKDTAALRAELTGSDETPAAAVKGGLLPSVPQYILNIHHLAESSDSEAVRLQANKLLVEWAVTDKLVVGETTADAEFKQLLKALSKKEASK